MPASLVSIIKQHPYEYTAVCMHSKRLDNKFINM